MARKKLPVLRIEPPTNTTKGGDMMRHTPASAMIQPMPVIRARQSRVQT